MPEICYNTFFSAFNNPKDQTLDVRAADLLGYTLEEMETYFHEHIQAFADTNGLTYDAAFAKIPHEWLDKDETEIKRYFLAYMIFARADVVSEEQHSLGRPDSVVKTEKAIYIVEFKYAQSADAALAQCREKRYADAYAADPRRVVYVGVNYDPAPRFCSNLHAVDGAKTRLSRCWLENLDVRTHLDAAERGVLYFK